MILTPQKTIEMHRQTGLWGQVTLDAPGENLAFLHAIIIGQFFGKLGRVAHRDFTGSSHRRRRQPRHCGDDGKNAST